MEIVEEVKKRTGMPYRVICKAMRLPVASFNRWRWRLRNNVVVAQRPGPKKAEPFDPAVLDSEIRLLDHGIKRSTGTTQLYRRNAQSVSRRDLARLVAQVRHDLDSDRRRSLRRIEWLTPRVVWAMDMTEYDLGPIKTYLHNTQDLGSRYKLPPIAGGYPVGEEIAGYLTHTFSRFGPPLFLKRDNGGNMNHAVVNDLLAEFFVLPLNSPAYYAVYNGAIEESQREVKDCLREKLALGSADYLYHVSAYAEAAVNDLNHRSRPCLYGKTSCQAFFEPPNPAFSKRDRKEIHDWVLARVERILSAMNQSGRAIRESAWRIAVEAWLQSKGYINIYTNRKCHPILSSF